MKNKIKILFIHGGMTFKNQKDYLTYLNTKEISLEPSIRWNDNYLSKKLGKDFEVIRPRMPLSENAKYNDWKIIFERYLDLIKGPFILVGVSLGGVFLSKYLSENKLKKKAISTYLICPPFDNSLEGEDLVGGFTLKSDLSGITNNTKYLHFMFSKDDEVVPIVHADKYKKKLPEADFNIYNSKNGHFKISEFPEIIKLIKNDIK